MASRAQNRSIGKLGNDAAGILSVCGLRTMTSFASHILMPAFALHFCLVGMAGLAGFVPGEPDRARPHIIHRLRAKMAVLAKVGRDDGAPDHQEGNQTQDQ